MVDERLSGIRVKSDGQIFWTPHRVYHIPCLIDMEKYPWDEYSCHLWFQSLAYSTSRLKIKPYMPTPFDLDTYLGGFKESDEWEIISNTSQSFAVPRHVGAILMFSRRNALRMTLTLRRRMSYTTYLLTWPCFVLSGMSCLVFCLPPHRPDRHAIGKVCGKIRVQSLITLNILFAFLCVGVFMWMSFMYGCFLFMGVLGWMGVCKGVGFMYIFMTV